VELGDDRDRHLRQGLAIGRARRGLDFFPTARVQHRHVFDTERADRGAAGQSARHQRGAHLGEPGGGTPTYPAIQGALSYTQTHAIKNPNHVVVIVLATDGQPNDCGSNVGNVSTIAGKASRARPRCSRS